MKKLTTLLSLVVLSGLKAQCNITGSPTVKINETATFSLENDNAQCSDCHPLLTVGGNSKIEDDFRKNSVK